MDKFENIKNYSIEFINCKFSSSKNLILKETGDFFHYLHEQTSILSKILELIKDFFIILSDFKMKHSNRSFDILFEDNNIKTHINNLEIYINILENKIKESNESKYLKNTYDSLFKILYNDVMTFKLLLLTYISIIQLDFISSTSNMILTLKNLEISKKKFCNQIKFRLYYFFWSFYFDNFHKYHLIFGTFLDKKQQNLLNESTNQMDCKVSISEDIFEKNPSIYVKRFMDKINILNIDVIYFIIGLEKKKFFDSNILDDKSFMVKTQYKYNRLLQESYEDIAIIKIIHQNLNETSKSILSDIDSLDKKNFNGKHKLNNMSILITTLYYNCFLAIKIKEKNSVDITSIKDICDDFKSKYADNHIFKIIN